MLRNTFNSDELRQLEGTLPGLRKQIKFKDIYFKIMFVRNLIFKNPANLKLKFVGSSCS